MVGSATFTTLASSTTMNWATATMASTALALARTGRAWMGMTAASLMSLGGDAFRVGEMCRQEPSGSGQRRGSLVEDRVVGLEDVGDPGGDVEGDLDIGGGRALREAERVVEEHLVRSGLDDQRR